MINHIRGGSSLISSRIGHTSLPDDRKKAMPSVLCLNVISVFVDEFFNTFWYYVPS